MMNLLHRLFRREPVTFSDNGMLRLRASTQVQPVSVQYKALEKPTCKRINLAEWKIKRAAQARNRARRTL